MKSKLTWNSMENIVEETVSEGEPESDSGDESSSEDENKEKGYLAQSDSDTESKPNSGQAPVGKQKAKLARTSSKKATRDGDGDTSDEEDDNEPNVLITEVPDMWAALPDPSTVQHVQSQALDEKQLRRSPSQRKLRTPEEKTEVQEEESWDTDLETDFNMVDADPTGRNTYLKACENLGVVPVSYFTRNITARHIVMRHHGLGPQGARAMSRVLRDSLTLEKFDLSGNNVTGLGALYLARMLIDNDYISEVNLAENQLGSMGAYHMSKMLQVNTGLRKLDLSGNGIGDSDGTYMAEAIEKNQALKELNLKHNDFGVEGGMKLGPAIGLNDIMENIDLSWNKLRRRGAIAIAKGVKDNVRLKTCNVSWNGFGPETGSAVADAIANNRALVELDISGNRLDYRAAVAIGRGLKRNEELEILRIGNNPITTAGCSAIVRAVKDNDASIVHTMDFSGIPVEFEFLKLVEEVQSKRKFTVTYGPILWSGNTPQDIGKPAMDPYPRSPLIVLREQVAVNDFRIIEQLQKVDTEGMLSVTVEQFAIALEEAAVPFTHSQLKGVVDELDKNYEGRIHYGEFMEKKALIDAQRALEAEAAAVEVPKRKSINPHRAVANAKAKANARNLTGGLQKKNLSPRKPASRVPGKTNIGRNSKYQKSKVDSDDSDDSDSDSDDSDEETEDDE